MGIVPSISHRGTQASSSIGITVDRQNLNLPVLTQCSPGRAVHNVLCANAKKDQGRRGRVLL